MDFYNDDEIGHETDSSLSPSQSESEGEEEEGEEEEKNILYSFQEGIGTDPLAEDSYKNNIIKLINVNAEFKFSINYQFHPELVPYFWASVHQYSQELLERFIVSDGWAFSSFLKAADKVKLKTVFRCAYSIKGSIEQKAKHFLIVFQILFEAAKFQWLAPWKSRNSFGVSTCMKRQIGGMYLSYYFLMQQPEPPDGIVSSEKQKMNIDPADSKAIRFFISDLDKIESIDENGAGLKRGVMLMFLKLNHADCFAKTGLKDSYSLEAPYVQLNGSKSNPQLTYFGILKDIRDRLLYMTFQGIGNTTFKEMLKVAQEIFDKNRQKNTKNSNDTKPCHLSREEQKSKKKAVTFQTRLRQVLDRQFQLSFQDENGTNTEPAPKTDCKFPLKSEPKKQKSPKKSQKNYDNNTFPPERKTHWTVDDVKALKDERDLSLIAFRIVEIMRFITPENPLIPSRLISGMRIDQTAKELMQSYERRGRMQTEKRLTAPSRLAKLSQRGKHRFMKTGENQPWLKYLAGDFDQKELSPKEMLKMLKTHDVVATEPHIVFKRRKHASPEVSDDELFKFEEDVHIKSEEGVTENSSDQKPAMKWDLINMPDLNTFWEDESGGILPLEEGPPKLSPLSEDSVDAEMLDVYVKGAFNLNLITPIKQENDTSILTQRPSKKRKTIRNKIKVKVEAPSPQTNTRYLNLRSSTSRK